MDVSMTMIELKNGIIEMMPSTGCRLVKMQEKIAAQGSVFLPSPEFAEGWTEAAYVEADALEEKWLEEQNDA